ncbi:MAG: hypothetical protein U5L96_12150 [Owenweeksia sp.]|nr:hypothetical protein [Owenweeksia sp.]
MAARIGRIRVISCFPCLDDFGKSWSEAKAINQLPGNCLDGDSTTEGAVPAVGPAGQMYVAWGFNEKIYFDKSENGDHWLKNDRVVAGQPGGSAILMYPG